MYIYLSINKNMVKVFIKKQKQNKTNKQTNKKPSNNVQIIIWVDGRPLKKFNVKLWYIESTVINSFTRKTNTCKDFV